MKNTALCLSNAVGRCLGSFKTTAAVVLRTARVTPACRLPRRSRYQFQNNDTFSSFLFLSKNLYMPPFDVSRLCNTQAIRDLQRTRSQARSGHVRGSDGYSPEPVRFELVHILLIYTRQPERAFRREDRCRLFPLLLVFCLCWRSDVARGRVEYLDAARYCFPVAMLSVGDSFEKQLVAPLWCTLKRKSLIEGSVHKKRHLVVFGR